MFIAAQVLKCVDHIAHTSRRRRIRLNRRRRRHLLLAATFCANKDPELWYHIGASLHENGWGFVVCEWFVTQQAMAHLSSFIACMFQHTQC